MKSFLLFVLVATLGGCDSPKPKQVVHRTMAGTKDETGWFTAKSTNGRFSVKLPTPFNDISIIESDPLSKTQNIEVVGCKSAEGIKFIALKTHYREKGGAAAQFEKTKTGGTLPSAVIKQTIQGNYPALDISTSDSKSRCEQRVVLIGEELYSLTIEWPNAQELVARPLVHTFFQSLSIN